MVSCSIEHVLGKIAFLRGEKNVRESFQINQYHPVGVFGFEWVSVDKTTVLANVQL